MIQIPQGYQVPENAIDLILMIPNITGFDEWKKEAMDYVNYPMFLDDTDHYDPSYSFMKTEDYDYVLEIICQYDFVKGLCRFGTEELFKKHVPLIRQVLEKTYNEDPKNNMKSQMRMLNRIAQISCMKHCVESRLQLEDIVSLFEKYVFNA